MSYHSPFTSLNPYRSLHQGDPDCIRMSNDFSRSDIHRIRSVVMDHGFINSAISRFVKHLYDYCEQHNLTFSDRDKLIDYITQHCPVASDGDTAIARLASPHSPGPTPSRPLSGDRPSDVERRPTPPMGADDTRAANVKRTRGRKQATEDIHDGK